MKRASLSFINVIIMVVGILFIAAFNRDGFVSTLVYITGVLFIIPGVFNIFALLREQPRSEENPHGRSSATRTMSWAGCVAALVLGASMCFMPGIYGPALIYIFSLSLLLGGLYHFYMIARGLRPVRLAAWTYLLPTVIALLGVLIVAVGTLRNPDNNGAVLVTGIGMILFALTTFIEMIFVSAARRNGVLADASHQIEDVSAEEAKK